MADETQNELQIVLDLINSSRLFDEVLFPSDHLEAGFALVTNAIKEGDYDGTLDDFKKEFGDELFLVYSNKMSEQHA